jgi:hypothetical protein
LAMAAKSIAALASRGAVVTTGNLKTASVTADHQDSATNTVSGIVPIEFVECDSRSVAVAMETSKTGVGNTAANQHRSPLPRRFRSGQNNQIKQCQSTLTSQNG